MAGFGQYIGVRYSGRKDPGDRLREIQVFAAREDHEPYHELNHDDARGRWSRRELAEWLLWKVREEGPVAVGLDHAFSFPQSYMDRHNLKSWGEFLADFEGHWPTHESTVRELDSRAKATHAGLPWLDYLRRAGDRVHFWPFDGWEVPEGRSLVAEVRPARLRHRYPNQELKREAHDAYAICAWLQERDRLDLLRPYFTPALSPDEKERALLEGWILGVA